MSYFFFFFFSSRRRHTRLTCDWSSDVCSSDLTVNPSTIRNWAKGHEHFRQVLTMPEDLAGDAVSFFNLIEIFVLDELRRRHRFSLQQLRPHIAYMRETFPEAR